MNEGLTQLSDDLTAVSFVPGTESAADYEALLSRTARLLRVKLTFEARRTPTSAPFVVVAGGTNVGKSTVFNWLVGEAIGSSSPLARHTKAPTVYVPRKELPNIPEGVLLPSYARMTLERPDDAAAEPEGERPVAYFLRLHENPEAAERVLIDSPDIDSTHDRNREVAEDLLFLADQVVFVSTPEKYSATSSACATSSAPSSCRSTSCACSTRARTPTSSATSSRWLCPGSAARWGP